MRRDEENDLWIFLKGKRPILQRIKKPQPRRVLPRDIAARRSPAFPLQEAVNRGLIALHGWREAAPRHWWEWCYSPMSRDSSTPLTHCVNAFRFFRNISAIFLKFRKFTSFEFAGVSFQRCVAHEP